jgi:hypothetical protein
MGVIALVSFTILYFYWLRNSIPGFQSDWAEYNFPLVPLNKNDWIKFFRLGSILLGPFGFSKFFIFILSIVGIVESISAKRNKYAAKIFLGILVTLFASWIGKYPVAPRLFLFVYPILAAFVFIALETALNACRKPLKKLAGICMVFSFLCYFYTNPGSLVYVQYDNNYFEGEEANELIKYMHENIESDEKLYVYFHSIPVFEYKNGYNKTSIGHEFSDNVILGKGFFDNGQNKEDIRTILAQNRIYLLFSHIYGPRVLPLLEELLQNGFLELILLSHGTPLCYYTNNLSDVKSNASYEILRTEERPSGKTAVIIRIQNTGNAILNSDFDNLALNSRTHNISVAIPQNITPGSIVDVQYEFDWKDMDKIEIQLVNEGKYWFHQIGVPPIVIEKPATNAVDDENRI